MRPALFVVATFVLACSPGDKAADTTSLPAAPDTVKPASVDSAAGMDTTRAAAHVAPAKRQAATQTSANTPTRSGASATPPDTGLRDSVIRFPLNDPRHRLPVVPRDTSKPPR